MKNKANWDSFVLTGCNTDPAKRDAVWKVDSTSSQFRIQKYEDQAYDFKGLIIDFDCSTLKFNNQFIAPIMAKSAIFHAGDYVVGLSQGSLVLHSSGIVYISAYHNWVSKGGMTSIPVIMGYVDADFILKFSGLITMLHLTPQTAQVNASYGYDITWRQSMIKSKLWNRTGKIHVGN
ncbi:MAG: hypothetical protein EZS28_024371 [Streblomastix strix]|uniref:Uncharacterized protein n=1 Tax=Streblomastix strix TaxID=222440 RepID=A0A5J4VCD1_9EUKA|nr:MAG: hypothetical protein EZS28_024371 [Streblomastix strix]